MSSKTRATSHSTPKLAAGWRYRTCTRLLPAALYAALVGGILRSSAAGEPSAAEMLALVNTSLIERPIDAQFVSMIYAIWDDDERTLQVSNSGLPRPILCHGGKPEVVEATG